MDFKKYLQEAADKTAVMAFGRFNPPTVGHEKLIQKVRETADEHGASGHVFASHSEGTRKDPLPQSAKIGYLNKIAYGNEIHGSSKSEPTFLHAAAKLYAKGHKHLIMVAGSDRVQEYKEKLEKYNDGKEYPHGKYKFKSIKVVSSGERDPDAEGVEGMSGTKMRELARAGKVKQFESGLPENIRHHSEEIINHIRAIKEDYENPHRFDDATPEGTEYMLDMTPGQKPECRDGGVWSEKLGTCVSVREAYINNEIYKLQDIVEASNGDKGPIVYRGSTYVTMQIGEGKTVKHWLKDIKESSPVWPNIIVKQPKKTYEQRIPALLMSKEQLIEMTKHNMEIEYDGYTTEYLHMCPKASEQLKELSTNTKLNPKYILQAIQATDAYLGIEKHSKELGFADEHMVHDFNMKLAIAHDTLNLLGYPDKDLLYMEGHIAVMAHLSMHPDGTFANETQNTVPTMGAADASEGYDASDYRVVIGKDGKKYKVKSNRIITDRDGDGVPDGGQKLKENKTLSKFKKQITVETYTADPATVHRDVNRTADKEVFHGIDKTHPEVGITPDKPVGLVSFKSYFADKDTQGIEKQKNDAMQDVHRAKAELSMHSPGYKMMKKSKQQLDV